MRGAVDLGALAQAREAQAAAAERAKQRAESGETGEQVSVSEVTEATFQADVIDRSHEVPVVIDFWATWCEPCKQLSPILERLASEAAGAWVLAKVDVDADQRLAQAFGVQSIPSLFAVIAGQPVPLFQGALPEPQVRQVLEELVRLAADNGVSGEAGAVADPGETAGGGSEVPKAPPSDPDLDAAADAIGAGDLDGAAAAYRRLLERQPGDPDGTAGLALVAVMQRARSVDVAAAEADLAGDPAHTQARLSIADVLVLSGRAPEAFTLLIDGVRRSADDDRAALRERLLELFVVVGSDDPSVGPARQALANALF